MNTIRAVGLAPGLIGGLFDILKGLGAVPLARWLTSSQWGPPLAGAAAVTGHCYSLYLILAYFWETRPGQEPRLSWWKAQPRFGGKGLGAGGGALLALSWPCLLVVGATFGLMVLLFRWRKVSGSPVIARSTTIALTLAPLYLWLFERSWPLTAGGILMAIVAIVKHIPYLELGPDWPNAHLERSAAAAQKEPVA